MCWQEWNTELLKDGEKSGLHILSETRRAEVTLSAFDLATRTNRSNKFICIASVVYSRCRLAFIKLALRAGAATKATPTFASSEHSTTVVWSVRSAIGEHSRRVI